MLSTIRNERSIAALLLAAFVALVALRCAGRDAHAADGAPPPLAGPASVASTPAAGEVPPQYATALRSLGGSSAPRRLFQAAAAVLFPTHAGRPKQQQAPSGSGCTAAWPLDTLTPPSNTPPPNGGRTRATIWMVLCWLLWRAAYCTPLLLLAIAAFRELRKANVRCQELQRALQQVQAQKVRLQASLRVEQRTVQELRAQITTLQDEAAAGRSQLERQLADIRTGLDHVLDTRMQRDDVFGPLLATLQSQVTSLNDVLLEDMMQRERQREAAAAAGQEVQQLKSDLAELQQQHAATTAQLGKERRAAAEAQEELRRSRREVERKDATIRQLEGTVSELERRQQQPQGGNGVAVLQRHVQLLLEHARRHPPRRRQRLVAHPGGLQAPRLRRQAVLHPVRFHGVPSSLPGRPVVPSSRPPLAWFCSG